MDRTLKQAYALLLAFEIFSASVFPPKLTLPHRHKKECIEKRVVSLMTPELFELKCRLKADGYDISSAIEDSRFRLYWPEKSKVTKDAAKPSGNFYLSPDFGFYTELSFEQAVKYYDKNRKWLEKAEKVNNISGAAEYIVAIHQIESNFGKKTGKKPVFNSLASMYVQGKRKKFAYNELKEFLSLKGKIYNNYFQIKGSWAGAFGNSQTIPSTYKNYYKDFDNDGVANPYSTADSIGFTANYLKSCGFEESIKKAIYGYNRSKRYVEAVDVFAKELKKRIKPKQKTNA